MHLVADLYPCLRGILYFTLPHCFRVSVTFLCILEITCTLVLLSVQPGKHHSSVKEDFSSFVKVPHSALLLVCFFCLLLYVPVSSQDYLPNIIMYDKPNNILFVAVFLQKLITLPLQNHRAPFFLQVEVHQYDANEVLA